MNKKNLLIVLAIYKFAIMNLALFILSKETSLGDNLAYTSMGFFTAVSRDHHVISLTTALTQALVYGVNALLFHNSYLVNIFFNMLSFIGIAVAISKIKLKRDFISCVFILVLFLPNFNLWASIAGKEALLVFFSGFFIRAVVDYFEQDKNSLLMPASQSSNKTLFLKLGFLLSIAIVILYKPAFSIFMVPLLMFISFNKLNTNTRLIFYVIGLLFFVYMCYVIRLQIDHFTRNINEAFPASAHSNRENIWTYPYAFFYTLPYTMWVSLWGPFWSELNNLTKMLTFFESTVLIACYFVFFLKYIIDSCQYGFKVSASFVLIASIILCVITLTAMGFINPGTAIRYRTNNYLFLLVFFYYLSRTNSGYAKQAEIINNRQFST